MSKIKTREKVSFASCKYYFALKTFFLTLETENFGECQVQTHVKILLICQIIQYSK